MDMQDPQGMASELEKIPGVVKASFVSSEESPGASGDGAGPGGGDSSDAVKAAIAAIVNHIPTEVVTGYVAVLAIVTAAPHILQWAVFAFFLVMTPFLYWLAVATGLKAKHKRVPWKLSAWPRRNMAITTFAFVAWAVVLPNSPMLAFNWYQAYMGLALAVMVAIVLAAIDRVRALGSNRGH